MKINLPTVTLICVDCVKYGSAINALQKSLEQITPARAVFLTDIEYELPGIEVITIPRISSKQEYSQFMIKELAKYFDTEHVLIVQWDGYVLDAEQWSDEYLKYSYIGSPWLYGERNVGNGGFSLRSKRLHDILMQDDHIQCNANEDDVICREYRGYLEKNYDIKFAPVELAEAFAFELREPNQKTFGFHSFFHKPYQPTVVLKRTAALGDVVSLEPVMEHFHKSGWHVVLDVPKEFYAVFTPHYFPVKHISEFDASRIPCRLIDLDLAYEIKPKQLHLKSYYQACGIRDGELRNNRLVIGPKPVKLFTKYAVIHNDMRETSHRNVYGVKWQKVQRHLEALGYTVIQVGKNTYEPCGTWMNTPTTSFLKWVVGCADLFIGIDSGPAHIAVACDVPAVLFFGSVCPEYIYADLEKIEVIQGLCEFQNCWHETVSVDGQKCRINEELPPCCDHNFDTVIQSINKILKK